MNALGLIKSSGAIAFLVDIVVLLLLWIYLIYRLDWIRLDNMNSKLKNHLA